MKIIFILLLFFIHLLSSENISVRYYEDASLEKKIADVLLFDETTFVELEKPSFGFSDSAYWVKIVYANKTDNVQEKVLEFLDNRLDRIEVYDLKGKQLNVMGDMLPFNNRYFNDANVAIPLRTIENSKVVRYLRVTSSGIVDLRHNTWEIEEYKSHLYIETASKAFYFGATMIMLVYNLIIFLFIRERAFFDYVVYHSALMVAMLYYNGMIAQVFLPASANLNADNVPLNLIALCTLMATQFARSYLNTKKISPKFDKVFLFFIALNVMTFVFTTFNAPYIFTYLYTLILLMIQTIFLLYVGFRISIIKNNKVAQFYFAGWITMLFAIIITVLISLGVVPRNIFTINMFQIGSLVEIALLSMGLAYRYNEKRNEVIKKDKELKVINENLEISVRERTHELNKEMEYTKSLLLDREILFKELYHRVKNNLQMLTSIVLMQKRRIRDDNSKAVLEDVVGRIKSLALIHEKLQVSDELDKIYMQDYLKSLLTEIKKGFPKIYASFDLKCNNILLDINYVTSIGLIVNELTTNSFKHAFEQIQNPNITLYLQEVDKNSCELYYSDNGNGVEIIDNSNSLGTVLIETLSKSQLNGDVTVVTEPSLSYRIIFPKPF